MPDHSIDVKKLMTAGDLGEADTIWQVDFTVKVPLELIPPEERKCPDCGEEHDLDQLQIMEDSIKVLGGFDAQAVVDRVREHILDSDVTDFHLRGVQLLAEAELT